MNKRLYHATIEGLEVIVHLRADNKHVKEYITGKKFPVESASATTLPHQCTLKDRVGDYYQIIAMDSLRANDQDYINKLLSYYNDNQKVNNQRINSNTKKVIIKKRCFNPFCKDRKK